jgi:hypothetical protein
VAKERKTLRLRFEIYCIRNKALLRLSTLILHQTQRTLYFLLNVGWGYRSDVNGYL